MGSEAHRAGTVVAEMVDDLEPPTGATPDAAPPRRRRAIDGRTLAIILAAATLGAVLAGYATYLVLGGADDADTTTDPVPMTLAEAAEVNADRLFGLALTTPDGGRTDLAELTGDRVAVVNFWQSTCAPCIEEMPLLQELAEASPELAVVGIATQDPIEEAQRFATQTGIEYPWALDPEGLLYYEARGVGMPTTLLLAADGEVLDTHTGAFSTLDELQAFADGEA